MELFKSSNCDVNYLAQVVNISKFLNHPDPEVKKLKLAEIDGYKVVISIDSEPGFYVYFPTLSQINKDFLAYANLFRDKELNTNPEKTGFFETNCKVSAIKLRGQVSEGFLIEFDIFNNWLISIANKGIDPKPCEFDSVKDGNKEFKVVQKYIKREQSVHRPSAGKGKKQINRGIDIVRKSQFRFHYDTVLLKKVPNIICPDDLISITQKIHGTSGISGYLVCNLDLNWWEKLLLTVHNKLSKESIDPFAYNYIYASRTKILNQYSRQIPEQNVWYFAHDYIKPFLERGMTIYYEIVGYMPTGGCIQKGYDYGCVPPKDEYIPEVNFKVRPYRITLTNLNGQVHEFSAREVQQWCKMHNLTPVYEYYYGYANYLYPDINIDAEDYGKQFMELLSNEKKFNMECYDPTCNNKVFHEGIVIKKENMRSEAFKLKCFAFVKGELANDDSNIEDNA